MATVKMQIVWTVLIVVFSILEGATIGLASIWFALGSGVALVSTLFGAPLWLQILLFFVVSIVTLILTRPLVIKYVNSRTQRTNADAIIGREATVTENIDNIAGTGMARVGGRIWTARSATGCPIEAGTLTTILAIEGVKVILIPQETSQCEKSVC